MTLPLPQMTKDQTKSLLRTPDFIETIGWLLAIFVPFVIYMTLPPIEQGIDAPKLFLCVVSCASVMWAFSLLPELVPMFFIILVTALLFLVDPVIILSGFSSATFITLLGISALTYSIIQSGALKRLILYFMQTSSFRKLNIVFFLSGVVISPFLPSIINRCQLLGSLLSEISKSTGITPDKKPFLTLFTHGFFSTTLFSNSFLTASLMNFIIFSVLPLQEQQSFQGAGWLLAAIVLTLFILASYVVVFFFFFRSVEKPSFSAQGLTENLKQMGSVNSTEKFTTFCLLGLFIGMLTIDHHHIPQSWLCFSILFFLLVLKHIDLSDFQRNADWSFILFLCSLVSLSQAFKSLKLDIWLYNGLILHFPQMFMNQWTLFLSMIGITLLLRLFLPVGAAVAILIPSAISVASQAGMSAWPLCFTILISADIWFFPYQCTFYRIYRDTFGDMFCQEPQFLKMNHLMNLLKIIAILISLPYWKFLSLI